MVFICTGNDKSNIILSRYTSNIDYFLLVLLIVSISKSSSLLGKSLLIIDAHFIYTYMLIYIYIHMYIRTQNWILYIAKLRWSILLWTQIKIK